MARASLKEPINGLLDDATRVMLGFIAEHTARERPPLEPQQGGPYYIEDFRQIGSAGDAKRLQFCL